MTGKSEQPDRGGRRAETRGVSLQRAYGASLAIFLAALLVSLRFDSARVSLGLTAGTALSVGILASWQLIVSRAFDPKAPRRGLAVALGFLKLPVLGTIIYVLIGRDLVSAPAFAVGFVLPQVAIALLAVGGIAGRGAGPAATTEDIGAAAPRA